MGTEKLTGKLVGAIGFEPTTLWSQTRCATRLRYAPTRSDTILIGPRIVKDKGCLLDLSSKITRLQGFKRDLKPLRPQDVFF
jgi:hypothetical protein